MTENEQKEPLSLEALITANVYRDQHQQYNSYEMEQQFKADCDTHGIIEPFE